MDIAVLADIHGNYIALDKCIKYAEKRNIDTFLFLGDYVGELAYPEKAMGMLFYAYNHLSKKDICCLSH